VHPSSSVTNDAVCAVLGPRDLAAAEPETSPRAMPVEKTITRPTRLAELYVIAEDREVEAMAGIGFGFARALSG
jgi:hypothetical protein